MTADPSTGSISGTVTDAADPSGLSGVCVTAASSDGGVTGTATTAGDGTYAISGLAPDTYNVEFDPTCGGSIASADVAQWFEMAVTKFAGSPVTVTSGGTASGTDADLRRQRRLHLGHGDRRRRPERALGCVRDGSVV